MKIPQRERPPGIRFNITPLIDVVFLLVIFFLVTAHFAQNEQVAAVELPQATQVDDTAEVPRRLIVSVTREGQLFVKGRPVDMDELEHLLEMEPHGRTADYEVRIRSDQLTPYARVEPILLACLRAGVTNVGFNVIEK
ncbi:MAG: biopolymer transporter ExbD [Planctomycetaceae bacterium]|nr:biopolymer transporter ExbD [Planctomycetaceae bacterium]